MNTTCNRPYARSRLWSVLVAVLLLVGCQGGPAGTDPMLTNTSLTLSAVSGPLRVNLWWEGADPVHLVYASNRDCEWTNYALCERSGMVPNASGGRHVLTSQEDGLEPNRDYHFVAEAEGQRTPPSTARALGVPVDTHIARLAADLPPGDFVDVESGLPQGFSRFRDLMAVPRERDGSGGKLEILSWTDSAHWDPERQRVFYIGLRKNKRFVSYNALENRWEILPLTEGEAPPTYEEYGHIYGRTALDWQRGHYYHLSGSTLYRYQIDEGRWEAFRNSPLGCYISMEWHYGLDMLTAVRGCGGGSNNHRVHGFRDGDWTSLGQSSVHGYQSNAQYNPVRNDMLVVGGNSSPRRVEIIQADGSIRAMRDAPFDITISRHRLTYDPSSGNYLVLHYTARSLYEYNPDNDDWQLVRDWTGGGWPFGTYGYGPVPVPIDELGVIFWLDHTGTKLYRHRSTAAVVPGEGGNSAGGTNGDGNPDVGVPGGSGVGGSQPPALLDKASSMSPGDWRSIETRTPDGSTDRLNLLDVQFCEGGELVDRSTIGNGWMDSFAYDPESQSFWALLMRDNSEKKLVWLDSDLRWHAVSMPWGDDCSNNRRPFNRLMLVDGYLYWQPARWGASRTHVGRFRRAPIAPYLAGETDVRWEDYGVGIGITSIGQNGDYAFEWFPEMQAFIAFLPGSGGLDRWPANVAHTEEGIAQNKNFRGRLWYWRPGDPAWTYLGRTYAEGYRGRLLYNPIRGEMLIGPGGYFGSGRHPHDEFAKITADGEIVLLDRAVPEGTQGKSVRYHTAWSNLTYDPVTGDYLWWNYEQQTMWRSPTGREWRVYEDFDGVQFRGGGGLFGADSIGIQVNPVPGTDLLIWFDRYRGVLLHRMDSSV